VGVTRPAFAAFSTDWSSSRFSRRSTDQTCQFGAALTIHFASGTKYAPPADVPGSFLEAGRAGHVNHGLTGRATFACQECPAASVQVHSALWLNRAMATFQVGGKVALVTGGARGIGFATAQALATRGARLVIVDLDRGAAEAAAARLPGQALGLAADVSDRGAMQHVVATIVEQRGGVDVVVANAGIAARPATVRAMNGEAFDRILSVNLGGVYNTVIAALPQIAARSGHIVVVSSVYAFVNGVGAAPYAMAKAGVEQLGRALRVELAGHGAGASVAYFGFIDTEMVHRTLDDDPVATKSVELLPKPLRKRLAPAQAGEAIARGIERRAPRIIAPKRWAVISVLRGIVNPLVDDYAVKDARSQSFVEEFDARGDQEQPLTA
jgi:NAD(P)-dependent dehydrogenase (short-subunit alcohol dehydrogenase family)